ncbi:UPF0145 domain protein [Amniculicola lignicola CBS 123094]|uniref:UPF0145 domain protein n=1 Tax=Amniculicola lignicola CBS 123094 TaxID=1392246 RepID=A0A6A5X3H8_9PLEO|nr:UPF0145 domain protein [Amniculicola lignicola CBS 123094]
MASSSNTHEPHTKSAFDPEEEPHCFTDTYGVITSTMNDLPGYRVVKALGTVYGLAVRTRNIGTGMLQIIKSVAGGELKAFTTLLYTSRDQAVERMLGECMSRGGNAIIALRFDTSELMDSAQVCAYGTACIVEQIE